MNVQLFEDLFEMLGEPGVNRLIFSASPSDVEVGGVSIRRAGIAGVVLVVLGMDRVGWVLRGRGRVVGGIGGLRFRVGVGIGTA